MYRQLFQSALVIGVLFFLGMIFDIGANYIRDHKISNWSAIISRGIVAFSIGLVAYIIVAIIFISVGIFDAPK